MSMSKRLVIPVFASLAFVVILSVRTADAQEVVPLGTNLQPPIPGLNSALMCDGAIVNGSVPGQKHCTGTVYNVGFPDVLTLRLLKETQAVHALLNTLNTSATASLAEISAATKSANNVLTTQVTFNADLRKSIVEKFNSLPANLIASDVMKKFKEDILAEVDKRIKGPDQPATPTPAPPPPGQRR